jgi:voltage-gated potassium channel
MLRKRIESGPPERRAASAGSWSRYAIPVVALVAVLCAGAFASVEAHTASSFWNGLWWALSLMTTVGFVDGAPATTAGKLLSSMLMLLGFALLALTTAAVASLFVREGELPAEAREQSFEREVLAELRDLRRRIDRAGR